MVLDVLSGRGRQDREEARELDQLPFPDLLAAVPEGVGPDSSALMEHMDLAFLGRASAGELDAELDRLPAGASPLDPERFSRDLFLRDLVGSVFTLRLDGHTRTTHTSFLKRVLEHPPEDLDTVGFRQDILRDLGSDAVRRRAFEDLYRRLAALLTMLRASRDDARLEPVRFRLDVLRAFRAVIDPMTGTFGEATSGLRRLDRFARTLTGTDAYRGLVDLLDHDAGMAHLELGAVVTGPNSGGKTRLLQAVGLTQILGQSGLFAPCRSARLRLAPDLFASIVELDRADQREGRLGTELVRLRTLFDTAPPGAVVLLDELCSGTNPSEAIEIVETVLKLLGRLRPLALVTTHFLDFAGDLDRNAAIPGLAFLQAEVHDEGEPTYRFVPGVAATSLAVGTARRLGIAFDDLERRLEDRIRPDSGDSTV